MAGELVDGSLRLVTVTVIGWSFTAGRMVFVVVVRRVTRYMLCRGCAGRVLVIPRGVEGEDVCVAGTGLEAEEGVVVALQLDVDGLAGMGDGVGGD